MQLNTFLDQGQNIFALESPLTERDSILAELSKRDHPVYYWNPAHTHLQIFKDGTLSDHKEIPQGEVETTLFCDDGVETPGIFLLEGVFTTLAPFFWVNKAHAFRNARSEQYLILSDPAVELEEEIKGLIPTACNTVPSSEEMTDWLQLHLGRTPDRRLVMACAGLFFGDLGHVLKGLLTQNPDDESLVSSINAYKVSQLSSRGLESMGDPDVKVGGLDLLEKYIDDRVKLFTPEARAYNIRQPRGIILWGLPGCQPKGSKVLLADGSWTTVEKVKVGDYLMSPQQDGSNIPVRVVDTCKYEDRRVVELQTKGRTLKTYRCSHNHIIPFYGVKSFGKSGVNKVVYHNYLHELTTDEIRERGQVFQRKARIFTTPAYDLPEQPLPIHPYVLGVLLGNGSLNKNPSVSHGKVVVLDAICRLDSQISQPRKNKPNCFISGLRKDLIDRLKALGLFGKFSRQKFVPEMYKKASLTQRLELLAGLIDTDGTDIEYSTVSKQLASDVFDLMHSVGAMARVAPHNTIYKGSPYLAYRVYYSTTEQIIPTKLDYKRRKERDLKWKDPRRRSFRIKDVGTDTVYGFTLEHGSQWYITDDYLVTHNTGKSLTTKHAATRMGIPLLATEWGQILDEDTAKAAANLRYVLQVAEACSPCIMAWDDFEKMPLGAMAGILLTWMQERTKPVYLIASINRLSKLPPELIRPGRFDTIFFVEPPHEGARKEIFSIHLEKHQVDTSSYTTMDWHKLISAYGRCTAAEIANAVKTAAEDVFCAKKPTVVTPEDLLFQRTLFEPSLIREEEALLGELKMAKNTRSACSPDNSEWKLQPSPMFKAMLG